jgi:hypothetical protein
MRIPPVASEIALIGALGARVLAVTLNGEGLSPESLRAEQDRLAAELRLPVLRPLEEGRGARAGGAGVRRSGNSAPGAGNSAPERPGKRAHREARTAR